ncbi:Tad domain-containing protein [Sphingobium sp. JS3065]|uniref:Tad domain-containing protein n=1 Tax=Sphingobium sp. JS3065 TaxID=2970925 RepID=UPI00226565E2|nr:Tad domain-containing protein [Sphingobium sp. JS3065]UZW56533.1 Tad domain-containing protein [Sphingobium sp. JS3065]
MGDRIKRTLFILMRLYHNQAGNILAITAAAIIPTIGLVGGAFDMARIYAVKTRLQSACDAGALAGRRVMGSGRWTDNNGRPNSVALATFDLNFAQNSFGSANRARAFSEAEGTVTGTASADVPMTLMQVLGIPTKRVDVACEGQMRIPNTDVMFVLDNSGSMKDPIPGDTTNLKKMDGLKMAIRCFYEALARQNITDVSAAECGSTTDPTNDLSTQVQLRFGFVNYDNMVNVGKLLPNSFLADSWTYRSRTATGIQTVYAWTEGTAGATSWTPWTPTPTDFSTTNRYSGTFAVVGGSNTSATTLADGQSYVKKAAPTSISTCSALNRYGSSGQLVGITENNGSSSNPAPIWNAPVYPDDEQTSTTTRTRTQTVTYGYRYRYFQNGSGSSAWGCWLERSPANNSTKNYTQSAEGTATRPLTWTSYNQVTEWTYHPRIIDVSSLKAGQSNWNNSLTIPLAGRVRMQVKLSGSASSSYIETVADLTAAWEGCIEERQTFVNTDGDPADDWINYPSSPSDAIDMDIDRAPDSDPRTQWKPLLTGAVWGPKATLVGNSWSGDYTTDTVRSGENTSSSDTGRNLSNNSCVTASRKMTNYNGVGANSSAQDFSNYVGTLVPHNNTYHDIGLLWGARLMSPTGIFASENAATSGGAQIQRHMIFMTDGATATTTNNYASYGLEWWDRRQITPAGPNDSNYDNQLNAVNNARSNALCTAIKNKNITLWVIYYGSSDTATKTRLTNCATSSSYFYEAKNTTLLINKFREIADRISNLRLTQ